jgi:hypothetical protein
MLKKQFKEKDVERMRNLIKGKGNARTVSGVGFAKKQEFHEEGDIWEEDGRQWTIKDGIKQNITKLDLAKKAHKMPMFCPMCKNLMHENRDKKLWNIHKKCLNCVVDMEVGLRKAGLWEDYQRNIINSDLDGLIEMYQNYMFEQINEQNNSFITEKGNKEKWKGSVDTGRAMKAMQEGIEYLQSLKK